MAEVRVATGVLDEQWQAGAVGEHRLGADQGRDLVIGLGGAPLIASGSTYNGYAFVDQQSGGDLQVTVYDLSGSVKDSWSVPPN